MKYEWPKIKRCPQKCSLFLRKRLHFWWAFLFIFGRLYFVRALAFWVRQIKHHPAKKSCFHNLSKFLINFGTLANTRDSSWDPESLQALFSLLLVSYKAQRGKEIEISYGDIKPIDPIYCHHFHFPQYAIISLHPQKYLLTSDDKNWYYTYNTP